MIMERVRQNPMRSDKPYTDADQNYKFAAAKVQILFEYAILHELILHLYPFVITIIWESKFKVLGEYLDFSLQPPAEISADKRYLSSMIHFFLVSLRYLEPWLRSKKWYSPWQIPFVIMSFMYLELGIRSNNWYVSWNILFMLVSFLYLQPWIRSNKWYLYWLLVAALYHLPPQPMDKIMRLDVSLFLTLFAFSILRVLVLLSIFYGLRSLFTRKAPKFPDIWNILKHSAVVSIAHCTLIWAKNDFYNQVPHRHPTIQRYDIHISWHQFIGLNILVYYLRTESMSEEKPDFLDMVPWYSGTSADLYKTVFDLLVSVNIFLGRFDLRMLLGVTNQVQDGAAQVNLLYDLSRNEELWFDFMADTGDGGNSTYTVTRLLAEPHICCDSRLLKRGDLLLIGGDLALLMFYLGYDERLLFCSRGYPNPSKFTYERRLFRPFEYALQPPVNPDMAHRDGPQCFVIPGNHDWFDGLRTFTRYICDKSWLGGWFMPQKTTYFALKLPQRWWIFGLDLALDSDIDTYQFQFFSKLARETIGNNDSVIVMTHQPDWLHDWYENSDIHRENLSDLICNILKERCKLRIAGDIHHYMRHSIVSSNGSDHSRSIYAQHLLVNGCGGAFTHPTHVFGNFRESHGVSYECGASYPNKETSKRLAFKNISKFRKENSKFDFVGGIMYFILVFSMFPQCELDHVFQVDSISGLWKTCFRTLWNAFIYMLEHSCISLGGGLLLVIVATAFAPSKVSWKTRVAIGILHVSAHLATALILMLVLELGVEALVRHKVLATSGYHSLYRWYESHESRYFNATRPSIEQWRFGLSPACIKNLMFAFDVPELMAVTRSNICKSGMASLTRFDTIFYYGSVFLYFWILSTPAVSYVFGSYLYICVNWFNLHYDEAFSSLRIADYKAFTRFHIKTNGDLEVFTLAVDKVPQQWQLDPDWKHEKKIDRRRLSHKRWFPSQWRAAAPCKDPLMTVRIIDQFVIRREDSPSSSETQEST